MRILPCDIVSDILSRLEVEDIVRCRSVCKTWNQITRESSFLDLHSSREELRQRQLRCLIRGSDGNSLFLVDFQNNIATGKEIPMHNIELNSKYQIVGSCNGLLCMASYFMNDPVLIYNPVTKEAIQLPVNKSSDSTTVVIYGFGFDEVSNTYKVVCVCCPYSDLDPVYNNDGLVTLCEIITVGEGLWRKLEVPFPVEIQYSNGTIFVDGYFHWKINMDDNDWIQAELILALDIHDEKFDTMDCPPIENLQETYIANIGESLAVVDGWRLDYSSTVYPIMLEKMGNELHYRYDVEEVHGTENFGSYTEITRMYDTGEVEHITKYIGYSGGMIGKLSDGTILYVLEQCGSSGRLALYDPGEKRCFLQEMSGLPCSSSVHFFVPTLVSPCGISSRSKKMIKRKRIEVCSVEMAAKRPKMLLASERL